MRSTLLTSAALLGLALAAPALAQTNGPENAPPPRQGTMNPQTGARYGHVPGQGTSLPYSAHASNITPQDTHSIIAPTLPVPRVENATTARFLEIARHALARRQTGLAQSALEQAMTARLNGDEIQGVSPQGDPTIGQIRAALDDLAARRWRDVDARIAEAISDARMAGGAPGSMAPGGGEYGMNGASGPGGAPGPAPSLHPSGVANPVAPPPHKAMPGSLGVETAPPGSQMNPTGSPSY